MIREAFWGVVFPVTFGYAAGCALTGCGVSLKEIEAEVLGPVPSQLSECRSQARAAYYDDKKTKEEALEVYATCKKRAGL